MSRWIVALALFQTALLSLFADDRLAGKYMLSDLKSAMSGRQLAVGSTMPPLAVYSEAGVSRVAFDHGRPTTLIFSACTRCNIEQIRRWTEGARSRRERVVFVLLTTPDQLGRLRREWRLTGEVYASRGCRTFRQLGIEVLPAQARIGKGGLVLGYMQEPSSGRRTALGAAF